MLLFLSVFWSFSCDTNRRKFLVAYISVVDCLTSHLCDVMFIINKQEDLVLFLHFQLQSAFDNLYTVLVSISGQLHETFT